MWNHPTMLAPMEGITRPELRAVMAARGGIGVVCTEFVRISRAPLSPDAVARHVVRTEGALLSVQVMGNDADKMAEAAGIVSAAGAHIVDVNLGCPMPRAVRKGVGAAMLRDLGLLGRVLRAMRSATPVTLSAKIRAGFDGSEDPLAIARAVEDAGVDFLVVHPRRRCDFYAGVADWRVIQRIKETVSIPVVGNGDVWYAADALRMQRETGCDAVMLGRPALRNPWIFEQIADLRAGRVPICPAGEDLLGWVRDRAHAYAAQGTRSLGPLKELVRYLGRAVDDGGDFKTMALRAGTVGELMTIAEAQLSDLGPDRLDLDAHGTLRLERSGAVAPRAAAAA